MRSLLSIDKVTPGVAASYYIGRRVHASLRSSFVMLFAYCVVVLIPAEAQQKLETPDPPNTCSQRQATECIKPNQCGDCTASCYTCSEIVSQCGELSCEEAQEILTSMGQICNRIPAGLRTCQFQSPVGVIEDSQCLTNGSLCNAPREATLELIFPTDAEGLYVEAVTGFVDDWNPSISFNGHFLINEQNESNSSPRALDFYQSITQQESPWVVPGSNTVRVSSRNQEGNWSIYVYLRGEYKTAGECNHVLPVLSAATESCQIITTCGENVVPAGSEHWDQNGDCKVDQTDIDSLASTDPDAAQAAKDLLATHMCIGLP